MNNKKIALVHDFLLYQGGAERVLKVLSDMYPEAPIYTLLYDKERMNGMFESEDIQTSYLQKFPKFLKKHHRWLLPFYPVLPETFDLREYDLVISSSGAWSKGIVTKLNTIHVAYLHSPMRFVWDYNERYLGKLSIFARFVFNYLRIWDRLAADRPDFLIANSRYTQKRIAKYYRRDSEVIYPPVTICHSERNDDPAKRERNEVEESRRKTESFKSTGSFANAQDDSKDYFLVVSRLSPYKKVDVVVEAFNKLGLPLIVIGTGQQEKHLKKIAQSNVHILGWQDEQTVQNYYQNALGFIFPCEDDFGIAPVEAMLHGVPIVAYRKGGAMETVQEGITGEFFDAQTPEVLADGIRRFLLNKDKYDREAIKKHAAEFSRERFEKEIREYIDSKMTNNPKQ
jgi:glycosyltransferase involved in cell wall biosynthesis